MLVLFSIMFATSSLLLLVAYFMYKDVTSSNVQNTTMLNISQAIKEGAYAYLASQYKIVSIVGIASACILGGIFGSQVALNFALGAIISGLASSVGMMISVDSNVFVANAVLKGSKLGDRQIALSHGFKKAIRAGGVVGFIINSFGIASISMLLLFADQTSLTSFTKSALGFCLGASFISVFARLGGGIFTKAADIGADLVGKFESDIPEDDPRNPAVIADNVGDNVGDCAGTAADVFETCAVSIIAAIQVSLMVFGPDNVLIKFIIGIMAACSFASIITVVLSRLKGSLVQSINKILNNTILISGVLIAGIEYLLFEATPITHYIDPITHIHQQFGLFQLTACALVGFACTRLLMSVTNYYTSDKYKPVRSIAEACNTGHATNIIYGLSVGMESVTMPALISIASMIACYKLAGIVGIAIAVSAMISLTSVIMTLDAYGPITDNAGGIVEMSGLDKNIRSITDQLDGLGNTTKAVTKGYTIGSAALATMMLFFTFVHDARITDIAHLSLFNIYVLVGLITGGLVPFMFAAMSMKSVGKIAGLVVYEVREQIRACPGILAGTVKPNYAKTTSTIASNSLKAMVLPALLPVIAPIVLFAIIYLIANTAQATYALAGMIIGVLITGLFLSLMMTNSGGAWDNAKKHIEKTHKGSAAHQAAITGDTVGDPFKDTAGPAINPMIKVISIVSLLIAALFNA